MTVDAALLIAFLAAFLRVSAMVFASPLFTGTGTPALVRVFFAFALSLALAPVLQGRISIPQDLYALAALGFYEIAAGLLIGFSVQMILLAAQVAGSFLDMQVGFGLASLLAPNTIVPTSIVAKFKFMLALVLFVSVSGHHILINAIVGSYGASAQMSLGSGLDVALTGLTWMSLLAMQIAMPVAAVAFVVDVCLGIVSRAVPQVNVLMAGISAKLLTGMIALSLALPALAVGVLRGTELAEDLILRLFRG